MKIQYDKLEASYPKTGHPCDEGWANQCAIRMSIALKGASFDFSGYTEPTCAKHKDARGAESLANFLWKKLFKPKVFTTPSTAKQSALLKMRGIVFFKDINGFRGGVGDHIDLWNGVKTKTGEYFHRCKQVWFFPIQ